MATLFLGRLQFVGLIASVVAGLLSPVGGVWAADNDTRVIQEMLTWTGHYDGPVDGVMSEETGRAIYRFKGNAALSTVFQLFKDATLTPKERAALVKQGTQARSNAGFTTIVDEKTGIQLGVPTALVAKGAARYQGIEASHWKDADNNLEIDALRWTDDRQLPAIYRQLKNRGGRELDDPGGDINRISDGWFALRGNEGSGGARKNRFFVRVEAKDGTIRGLSISYTDSPERRAVANAVIANFVAFPENTAPYYFSKGQSLSQQRNYDAAIDAYGEALRLDPNHVEALVGRALAYTFLRNWKRAIADATEALKRQPDYRTALDIRGYASAELEDYQAAIKDLTAAIASDDKPASSFNHRAFVRRSMGDLPNAFADVSEALKRDSGYPAAYANRGLIYFARANWELAKADFSRAASLTAPYPTTRWAKEVANTYLPVVGGIISCHREPGVQKDACTRAISSGLVKGEPLDALFKARDPAPPVAAAPPKSPEAKTEPARAGTASAKTPEPAAAPVNAAQKGRERGVGDILRARLGRMISVQ